jgi:hypothetical protein
MHNLCFNSLAQEASMEDFALDLSVVEDEVVSYEWAGVIDVGGWCTSALEWQRGCGGAGRAKAKRGDLGCTSTKRTI